MSEGASERALVCERCVLYRWCTRTSIHIVSGYCWADALRSEDPTLTKEEIARRHELDITEDTEND